MGSQVDLLKLEMVVVSWRFYSRSSSVSVIADRIVYTCICMHLFILAFTDLCTLKAIVLSLNATLSTLYLIQGCTNALKISCLLGSHTCNPLVALKHKMCDEKCVTEVLLVTTHTTYVSMERPEKYLFIFMKKGTLFRAL